MLVNKQPEDGQPLSDSDFDNYFLLLVIAGNETTRHAISQSMLALIENQDQLRKLQDEPSLIQPAVEEMLRWASPVYHFRRPRPATWNGRQADQGRRQGRHVVRLSQPRRVGVRGPVPASTSPARTSRT
jgi:cytochrome P450